MKPTRIFATIMIIVFILMNTYSTIYGIEAETYSRKVYIIVANKLTLQDIEKMPNLNKILDESGLGLMNVRGTSGYTGAESFATINASSKAYANNNSSQFYNLNGMYKEIYESRVGPIEGEYSVGNIELGRIYNQNEDNSYTPYIGLLGDSLHKYGLKTAIFGNSDTMDYVYRYAALIPMDSRGLIDYGNVDDILVSDKGYPYGLRTDYAKILDEIQDIQNRASLIVVDTGDLYRLHSIRDNITFEMFLEQRDAILNDIDSFIGQLINNINREQSLLFIFSPNSGEEKINGSKLSPLVLWGNNIDEGILYSSTTNNPGIVSNLDIGPTIADFFHIEMARASGNKITWEKRDDAFSYIKSINGRIDLTSKVRSKTLSTYGVISIIILSMVAFFLLINIRMDFNINKLMRILLLIIYGMPLIFILSSLFNINSIYKFLLSITALVIIYILIMMKCNGIKTLYTITFSYFVVIVIDILLNGAFSKFSLLSYDPIIGARYYGIGNEMVGLFLAFSMISISLIYKRVKNIIALSVVLLLTVILVGHPQLGANVGGMITFLSASLLFVLEAVEKKFSFKNMITVALIIGVTLGILGFIDIKFNPNPTHLGKALMKIGEEGLYIANNIVIRKLMMNIKLVGNSFWTKVLFSNIIIHGIFSYFHKDRYKGLIEREVSKGYISCLFGSIIGFLVNDSGLILAAIAVNISTIFLLFILTEDKRIQYE